MQEHILARLGEHRPVAYFKLISEDLFLLYKNVSTQNDAVIYEACRIGRNGKFTSEYDSVEYRGDKLILLRGEAKYVMKLYIRDEA